MIHLKRISTGTVIWLVVFTVVYVLKGIYTYVPREILVLVVVYSLSSYLMGWATLTARSGPVDDRTAPKATGYDLYSEDPDYG